MRFDIYMPASPKGHGIIRGSGIVGTVQEDGRLLVDYEGNLNDSPSIITFADRVHYAAGRQSANYPTAARHLAARSDFVHLGSYDFATGEVNLGGGEFELEDAQDLLRGWLEVGPTDLPAELLTRGSATLQLMRDLAALRASGDP